jgi:hypothetical protein
MQKLCLWIKDGNFIVVSDRKFLINSYEIAPAATTKWTESWNIENGRFFLLGWTFLIIFLFNYVTKSSKIDKVSANHLPLSSQLRKPTKESAGDSETPSGKTFLRKTRRKTNQIPFAYNNLLFKLPKNIKKLNLIILISSSI